MQVEALVSFFLRQVGDSNVTFIAAHTSHRLIRGEREIASEQEGWMNEIERDK